MAQAVRDLDFIRLGGGGVFQGSLRGRVRHGCSRALSCRCRRGGRCGGSSGGLVTGIVFFLLLRGRGNGRGGCRHHHNIRRGVHLRGTGGRQRCRTFRCGGTARRGGRGRGCRFRGGRGGSFRGGGFRRSGFTRCGFRRCRLAQRFLPAEKPQNIPQHRDVQQRFHKAGPWGLTGAFRIGGRCCCHTQAKRRTQCQHTHVCLLHVSVPLFLHLWLFCKIKKAGACRF